MSADSATAQTYRLEQLVDPAAWIDVAIARAAAAYPAITTPRPSPALLRVLAARWPAPLDRLVHLLRVAAAGGTPDGADDTLAPDAAVSRSLAARLLDEHLLGDTLFEALRGEPPRYTHGAGLLGEGRVLIAPQTLRAQPRRPRLDSPYEPAVTLFLLSHHGFHEVFGEVHCADA